MAIARHLSYVIAVVREREGITAVFEERAKEALSLSAEKVEGPFALISFSTITALSEHGITAKISAALAREKIPSNFFAGFYHDHVLVPYDMKEKAMAALLSIEK